MASTYLTRKMQVINNITKKWTFSAWIKRSALGKQSIFATLLSDSGNTYFYFNKNNDNTNL